MAGLHMSWEDACNGAGVRCRDLSYSLPLGVQILVFDRKEPMQKFLDTCRGKLHIKKKAKGVALLEGDEVRMRHAVTSPLARIFTPYLTHRMEQPATVTITRAKQTSMQQPPSPPRKKCDKMLCQPRESTHLSLTRARKHISVLSEMA